MPQQNVLPTTPGVDSGGVQHFLEGHGEFSLIRIVRCAFPMASDVGTQLRLGQEREAETIRRWCRRYLRIDRCDEQYSYFHFRRPIPKHNGRSPKSGASLGCGVPPSKDPIGASTDHSLIHRDVKGDAQCHTLQSARKIQATSSFTTKTMARANRSY